MKPLGPISLILLALPALALTIALRILFGRARRQANDPMQVLLSVSATILFVFAAGGGIAGVLGGLFVFADLSLASVLGTFVALIIASAMIAVLSMMYLDRTRRSEHQGLIWALAAAATRGIPLPEAARAFADETPGATGARAQRLAEALEQGQSLVTARRSAGLRMGTAMRLTTKMAEPLGMLGPAMRQQLDDSQHFDAALRDAISRFFYLGVVVAFMVLVSTFVTLRIVPVFQRMFEEFGLKLPALTLLVIQASNWFVRGGWLPSLPLFVVVLPGFLVAALLYYVGWFPRDIPIVWRLFKRFDGALIMRSLALAVQRGMPLPEALRLVAESYPQKIAGQRLLAAASEVEAGSDWCQSLLRMGFISPADAAVLAAAQRAGNLAWALEEMAASALRRQVHRIQVGLQILFPAALLVIALFVFLFVCGLFLPLISLIQGLS